MGNAANVRAQKAAEKAAERERKRVEKEQTQQKKREEKEKAALEKQRDIAMRNAEREARRAAQPGECHRVSDHFIDNLQLALSEQNKNSLHFR